MKKILLSIIIAFFSLVVSQEYNIENCNGNFLITNVSVIKGDGTPPIFDQNVKIKNGIIENIFPFKKGVNIENSYCVINAKGKFLSPGFIDSHVHLALGPVSIEMNADVPTLKISHSEELTEISLKLLLESGITTIRDPGGKTTITTSVRSSLENGELIGPDLVVAGALLDTTNFVNLTRQINSSDDIYDEIDRQLEFNVDWVKLYTGLNPDETKLAIEYAKNKGLKTTAHLDNTTWTEAANAGIDNIVHIIPGSERLLPKESRGQYNQSRMTTASFFKWFEYVDLNGPEIREMISALKKNNVSVDPTMILFHSIAYGDEMAYRENPALRKLPEVVVENWKTFFHFNIGWTEKNFRHAKATWPKVLKFVKQLFEEGIMLTVGTDANNPFIVPGESFHNELEILVNAGIEPVEVHKMATLNGAKLIGREKEIGTIEIGKQAHLVLLDGNPTEDISTTRDIIWVMKNGRMLFQR